MKALLRDFRGRVAPAALAVGAEGGDAEPVFGAARQARDGGARACDDGGLSPRGGGRRVGAAFDDVTAGVADSVPVEIEFAVVVAFRDAEVCGGVDVV